MATSVEYPVAAILQVRGGESAEAKFASLGRASDRAAARVEAIGSAAASGLASLGGIVGGAVDTLASFAVRGGMALGAAGLAGTVMALKTGIVDVNARLEEAQLGFGTIFNMFGASNGLEHGLGMAQGLIGQIREDARSLPGEFGDFVAMAQTITSPILQAGAGLKEIRGLTRDTVVAASALGVRFDQAAREMAMLLEGHAGGHNVLGTRLGITAHTQIKGKTWLESGKAERLDYVQQALGPAKESLARFQTSWTGLTSTLVDTGKQLVGRATAPVFERIRVSMIRILQWGDEHKVQLERLADIAGQRLVWAWGWLESHAERLPGYWARARNSAKELLDGAHAGLQKVMPLVDRAAALMERAFAHPLPAIKALAGLRIGAAAAQFAPGAIAMGGGLAQMFGGGGGAAAAVGGAAEAVGGAGAAVGGGAAAATAGIALVAVAAVAVAAIDNVGGSFDRIKSTAADLWTSMTGAFEPLVVKGGLVRDILGQLGSGIVTLAQTYLYPLVFAFKAVQLALDYMNTAWGYMKDAMTWVADLLLHGFNTSLEDAGKALGKFHAWLGSIKDAILDLPGMARILGGPDLAPGNFDVEHPTTANEFFAQSSYMPAPEKSKSPLTAAPTVDARGSHITIQLHVKDNDPDRIIRRVYRGMGESLTHPIQSSRAPAPGF